MFRFSFIFLLFACLSISIADLHANKDKDDSTVTPAAPSFSNYYKKLKYEISLAYTQASQSDWWTKIEPFNIYLGALPLKNKGHLEEIVNLEITRVLSLVEDFEFEDGWFNQPAKAEDWKAYGIEIEHITAVDFYPLKREEIEKGVEYLRTALDEGCKIYVHCKAGRGRSASVVIAYLIQYHNLSFEEAYVFVKEQRPQINLNGEQRKAILDYFGVDPSQPLDIEAKRTWGEWFQGGLYRYFETSTGITEENLTSILEVMLNHVIEGGKYGAANRVPEFISGWMPEIEIESTISRRNRYLREYEGNQERATEASIKRNHGLFRSFKLMSANMIPVIGTPMSYSMSLWHQLREIALIAAIHGHDLHAPEVKMKMLTALVGGNLLKIPSASVDLIARHVVKMILAEIGMHGLSSSVALPAHLIFNYFTMNSAKVSTHAKALFAGENTIPIPIGEYHDSGDSKP